MIAFKRNEFWANFGYRNDNGDFIRVTATPLDDDRNRNSRNPESRLQAEEIEKLYMKAYDLKPGETKIIDHHGMVVQLRRIGTV